MAPCNEKLPIWQEWILTEELGRGANGRVYRAERDNFGDTLTAAIKVIPVPNEDYGVREDCNGQPDRCYYEGVLADNQREIKLMFSLQGITNIVSIQDSQVVKRPDRFGWDIYIRMELLTCLTQHIRGRFLSEQEVIKLGRNVCKALTYCQSQSRQIIHRDIKPANIFVNKDGDYKLGDFGEARKFVGDGQLSLRGTPHYMAPELASITALGASSQLVEQTAGTVDTYSLGVTMYQLLNFNRLPYLPPPPAPCSYEDNERAFAQRMAGAPLPPPACHSKALAAVVQKACSFRSEDRYLTAAAFEAALAAVEDADDQPPTFPQSAEADLPKPQPVAELQGESKADAAPQGQTLSGSTLQQSLSVSRGGCTFRPLPDGSLELTGYSGASSQLSLPEQIGGRLLTAIGAGAFLENQRLEAITTPASLRTVGPLAFAGCAGLRQVTLADGLRVIGDGAFLGCQRLRQVRLPDSLEDLGCEAFANCGGLTDLSFPAGLRRLGSRACANCPELAQAYLPQTLQELGDGVFTGCLKLHSARTPRLSNGLFRDCVGLRSLAVSDGAFPLGHYALAGCASLGKLTLPPAWPSMGIGCCSGCAALTELRVAEGVGRIPEEAFAGCGALKELSLPNSLEHIAAGAFAGCNALPPALSAQVNRY